MKKFFDTKFEDVRLEHSLLFLLSVTDPDILKQSGSLDRELNLITNLSVEKTT